MNVFLYFPIVMAWFASGLVGARWIHCLWFSVGLRDLREPFLSIPEIMMAFAFGPLNILLGFAWWAMGMGRND